MASVTNKFKFDKKSNVIHLTTSETMRMGESELLESCVRIIPSPSGSTNLRSNQSILLSRKKTPSSFQITEVCLTRTDIGDDSADDLDESHTDDNSRVTDNETPSFSEDSRDTEDHHGSTIAYAQSPIAVSTTTGPSSVVPTFKSIEEKFEPSAVKIKNHRVKGRWTCLDYVDPQQIPVSLSIPNHETFVNQYLKSSSALKDCELFLEKEFYDVLIPDKNGVSLNMIKIDDAYRRVASILTTTTSGKLISTSENCTVAIDSKIEQAMDLVKSHLMYAVRQDVNILKLKISELLVRISQLEAENLYLRANASPEVLKLLDCRSKQQI